MIERQSNQGSESWLRDRAGSATASCFADILSVSKRDGKPLKARDDYLMRMVVERITGEPTESASSFAMARGTDAEPFARAEYELVTGSIVTEVGFIKHQKHKWVGASLDGRVGPKGATEFKCPHNSAIHLATWAEGMPEHHVPQVQGQIWVADLDWVDFCSYDPRMQNGAEHLKLYVQRVYRDNAFIANLESEVAKFLAEVQVKINDFMGMRVAA